MQFKNLKDKLPSFIHIEIFTYVHKEWILSSVLDYSIFTIIFVGAIIRVLLKLFDSFNKKKAGETNEKFETPHDAAPVAGRGLREMTTSKKGDGKA